ncbi:DUF305 domain-containing protein [Streptomyces xinghaiensis]|uniref:DUF305 domain-containing protein n=1 Tax=Streptomyces xinghaiensis TaxID=1038928 RepID=UPI002E15A07C|nr:DUF305 domain-containing protein [Streptomyces xinghaiensis]
MRSTRTLSRRAARAAAAGAAALVLAACGGESGDNSSDDTRARPAPSAASAAPETQHNAADVAFAQGMIPHHEQAVEMARLARGRAASDEVGKLAGQIEKAQVPEIETLDGWLGAWGEERMPGGMDPGAHEGHGMSGMMDAGQMKRLESASGKAFDTAFLELMIEHHEGAVTMARTQQKQGEYGPARKMAAAIVTSQGEEIARMKDLLGR